MKILLASLEFSQPELKEQIEDIKSQADEVVINPYGRPLEKKEILELWKDVDGIIAGHEDFDAAILAQAPESLKVISKYGAGYENINLKAAGQKGIVVSNTPGVNAKAVADLALGLMLSVARSIPQFDSKMRKGNWCYSVGVGLDKKTIGIVGLGAIGKEVAERAKGFSMDILAYDPYFNEEFAKKNGIQKASLDEIYEKSDFITLHLPVTNQTEGMINAEALKKMKNTAILINAARGPLINETDLYNALKDNEIGGAGLDVYEKEPLIESPLFELDNVVICPHGGAATIDSIQLMGKCSIENTMNILNGNECKSILNGEFLVN